MEPRMIWWIIVAATTGNVCASYGSIASWWTTSGPNIAFQDPDSGEIRYSLCNGDTNIPRLPSAGSISLSHPPKRNSSLAGDGFSGESAGRTNGQDDIIEAQLQCDLTTGLWTSTQEIAVTDGLPASLRPANDTGLASVRLGSNQGWRLFYNTADGRVRALGHMRGQNWGYWGAVSQPPTSSRSLASTNKGDGNMTVATPRGPENIAVSHFYDNVWHVESVPRPLENAANNTNETAVENLRLNATASPNYTLPAWDVGVALGLTIDNNNMQSVFYVGTDRALHRLTQNVSEPEGVWRLREDATWPLADEPSARIAVASSSRERSALRVYYVSGGGLVEISGDGEVWLPAQRLPVDQNAGGGRGGGLSTGAKIGIGVGVAGGVVLLVASLGCFLVLRRRRRRAAQKAEHAAQPLQQELQANTPVTPAPKPPSAFTTPKPEEAHSAPVYEKPDSPLVELDSPRYIHEMPGVVHEMPDTSRARIR